jgi:phosphotransferase system enzyme I (PtsP)
MPSTATNPLNLLRRLREIMAGLDTAQVRLDQIVSLIAREMTADVCSVYLLRGGMLELFATEGLRPEAVHHTTLSIGEGLVGMIAKQARPFALSEARDHPNFAYRPETGEDLYHSLMGVPVLRGGRVVGVLVSQNKTPRVYNDDEVEAMQTVAMVVAEMVSSLLAIAPEQGRASGAGPLRLTGLIINEGLAQGQAVLHQPRIVVEKHIGDNVDDEMARLDTALQNLREQVEGMVETADWESSAESREIMETYRMFARDRGWVERLRKEVHEGLTAEAAVERVQVDNRARMSEISDPYLRERLYDLEDLSNRMLRHLTGNGSGMGVDDLPERAILIARNMGPAELLDYDRTKLVALLLEDGSHTSHVAIVAKALRLPVVGRLPGLLDAVEPGDDIAVDGDHNQVFVRPGEDAWNAFQENLAIREAQEAAYAEVADLPSVSKNGVQVGISINAGLLVDLPQLDETGADGIGLYRTELQFMVRSTLPQVQQQADIYGRVLDAAGDRPVVFRTLDVGGDKMLPYLTRYDDEQNPAMGWRAMRLALDRPVLLRMQLRALLKAASGRSLKLMFPMISEVAEFDAARKLFDREIARLERLGEKLPTTISVGTMLEVPGLAWQLDALLDRVDFVSIGSNDLMQFLFASDRGNPHLAGRYDFLSPAALSFLRDIVRKCNAAGVPVSLCGEAAGGPIEAMALLGLGLRNISLNAASLGRVKMMVRSLDVEKLARFMDPLYASGDHSLRPALTEFAEAQGVRLE